MDDNNKIDYEKELNDAVQYAVRSGDFSKLKDTLGSSMQGIVGEVGKSFSSAAGEVSKSFSSSAKDFSAAMKEASQAVKNAGAAKPNLSQVSRKSREGYAPPTYMVEKPATTALAKRTPVLPSGGCIAIFVLGILGTIFTAPGVIVGLILSAIDGFSIGGGLLTAFSTLMAGSIFMIVKGSQGMGRTARYKKYWRLLAQKGFCSISSLAHEVRKGTEFVLKDISSMFRKGWFPEGHLDEKQTCLIYGQELYQQYLATQAQQKQLLLEQEKRQQDTSGIYAVVDAGKEWIAQIRRANDKLPGEVISNKLYQLEDVTTRIFAYVEQRPEKLPDIRRFMEYYLPTTIKLVNAYCEFEGQPIPLESAQQSKKEIEESLDTINQAFLALLDNLYQDDAIDISTDISALKAMLAQEGLSQNKFGE